MSHYYLRGPGVLCLVAWLDLSTGFPSKKHHVTRQESDIPRLVIVLRTLHASCTSTRWPARVRPGMPRPDDRLVSIDRVLDHATLAVAGPLVLVVRRGWSPPDLRSKTTALIPGPKDRRSSARSRPSLSRSGSTPAHHHPVNAPAEETVAEAKRRNPTKLIGLRVPAGLRTYGGTPRPIPPGVSTSVSPSRKAKYRSTLPESPKRPARAWARAAPLSDDPHRRSADRVSAPSRFRQLHPPQPLNSLLCIPVAISASN